MRCPRCAGFLIDDGETVSHCVNCGYYAYPPYVEPFVSPRFLGTSACAICGEPRCKRSTLCRSCSIVEGFAKARNLG